MRTGREGFEKEPLRRAGRDAASEQDARLDSLLRELEPGDAGEDFVRRVRKSLPARRWWWSWADAKAAAKRGAGVFGSGGAAAGEGGRLEAMAAVWLWPLRGAVSPVLLAVVAAAGIWFAAHDGREGDMVPRPGVGALGLPGAQMAAEGTWWDAPDSEIVEDLDWLEEELALASLSEEWLLMR